MSDGRATFGWWFRPFWLLSPSLPRTFSSSGPLPQLESRLLGRAYRIASRGARTTPSSLLREERSLKYELIHLDALGSLGGVDLEGGRGYFEVHLDFPVAGNQIVAARLEELLLGG